MNSPASSLGQALPQRICPNFPLDQLLPQYAIRYDALPLPAHQLGIAEAASVQVTEDLLRYVVQAFLCATEGDFNDFLSLSLSLSTGGVVVEVVLLRYGVVRVGGGTV